jgi:AcrR family transcriptional regulator
VGNQERQVASSNGRGGREHGEGAARDLPGSDGRLAELTGDRGDRAAELVRQIHRMWVVAATAKIASEAGIEALTVPRIAHRAGLPQGTVIRLFGGPEGCLAGAFETAASIAAERTIPWFAAEVGPVERTRTGVACLVCFCEQEPELANLLVLEASATSQQRDRMVRTLARVLADEFSEVAGGGAPEGDRASRAIERATVRLRSGLLDRVRAPIEDLSAPLLEALLAPYLGERAARIEAARPVRAIAGAREPLMAGGARACLDVRLTADLLEELAEAWRASGS